MKHKLVCLLVTLAAMLAAGCAAVVMPSYEMPPAKVNPGKVIYVFLSPGPEVKVDEDYTNSMKDFKTELTQKFSEFFAGTSLVYGPPPAGSTVGERMNITITAYNYVSGAGRFFAGMLVGHAKLQVHVVITDLQGGKPLDDAKFGTVSNNAQGIFGAITSKQIDGVTTVIVRMFSSQIPMTS